MIEENCYVQPEVSICIATYNSREMLMRLLESIKKQKFKDYEVIVCDDSDNNDSEDVCREFEEVRYYHNKVRLGATLNNNKAISLARGKYVKVMHHDDYFSDENSLQRFVDMFNIPMFHGNFVFSGRYDELTDGSFLAGHTSNFDIYRIRKSWKSILFGAVIGAPSVTMWRNNIENPFLFDPSIAWFVDLEAYCRMLKTSPDFKYCAEPLIVNGEGNENVKMTNIYRNDTDLIVKEGIYMYEKMGADNRRFLVQLFFDKNAPEELLSKYNITLFEILFWRMYSNLFSFLKRVIIFIENHLIKHQISDV